MWRAWPAHQFDKDENDDETFHESIGSEFISDREDLNQDNKAIMTKLHFFMRGNRSFTYHILGLPGTGKTVWTMRFVQTELGDCFVRWITIGQEHVHVCVQRRGLRYASKFPIRDNIPEIVHQLLLADPNLSEERQVIVIDRWNPASGLCKELTSQFENWLSQMDFRRRIIFIWHASIDRELGPNTCASVKSGLPENFQIHLGMSLVDGRACLRLLNNGFYTACLCESLAYPHQLWQENHFYAGENQNFFYHELVNIIIKKIRHSLSRFSLWDGVGCAYLLFNENAIRFNWNADTANLFRGNAYSCGAKNEVRPTLVSRFAALEFARVHGRKGVEDLYLMMRRTGSFSMNDWWQEMWLVGSLLHGDVHIEYSFYGTEDEVKVIWKKTEIEYFDPENPPAYFGGKWLTPAARASGMYSFLSEANNILRCYYCSQFINPLNLIRILYLLTKIRGKQFDFVYIVFITGKTEFENDRPDSSIHSLRPEDCLSFVPPVLFRKTDGKDENPLTFANIAVATVNTYLRPIERSDGEAAPAIPKCYGENP